MLALDVFADLACPFCFLGHRRLARILAEPGMPAAEVRHRAFELRPDLPAGGVPAGPLYREKFGGEAGMRAAFARVEALGPEEGIRFALDRQPKAPGTFLGHRVVKVAGRLAGAGAEHEALDRLYAAHFERALDVTDLEVLLGLVADVPGLDGAALREAIASGGGADEVRADEREAAALGVTGVPLFVANGRLALSGAQPPEVFRAFLARVSSTS